MNRIPNPDTVFPNEYGTSCFLKNVITAPNIFVGDYTYYDDPAAPADFEKNNVLFNWPEFGDRLIIGKFCCIASGARFIMGSANHRMCSVTTYPFNVFGGAWAESKRRRTCPSSHSRAVTIVVGSDVWLGRECTVMPGVKIGDGAIVAAYSVVTRNVDPYTVVGGNPARLREHRFDAELTGLLLQFRWWDLPAQQVTELSAAAVRPRPGACAQNTARPAPDGNGAAAYIIKCRTPWQPKRSAGCFPYFAPIGIGLICFTVPRSLRSRTGHS